MKLLKFIKSFFGPKPIKTEVVEVKAKKKTIKGLSEDYIYRHPRYEYPGDFILPSENKISLGKESNNEPVVKHDYVVKYQPVCTEIKYRDRKRIKKYKTKPTKVNVVCRYSNEKKSYKSKEAADRAIRQVQECHKSRKLRSYYCRCTYWHITSKFYG